MNLKTLTQLLLFICLIGVGSITAQRDCGTMQHYQEQLLQNPDLLNNQQSIEKHTNKWIQNYGGDNKDGAIVTIPVVVHVVYNNNTENISDAQINSQMQILNDDFRRLNSDADGTWSQAADTEIEFCLATQDPNGNATSGITRTSTSVSSFSTNDSVKFDSSGGKDAWPAADYLNIWVCDISGGILGYAQFPGGPASTDGVVNDYAYFGDIGTATAPFDLGRTCTHEVGHYLNLRHIWGDGGCNVDDFVSDTPTSDASNGGCNTGHVSCGSVDMVQNYMDYSDDACMNLFTAGQRDRMQALFGSGGSRVSLLSSNGCGSGTPPVGCSYTDVDVTIVFDNYPEETAWVLTDDTGATVSSGGTYSGQADGSTLVIDLCLPDGCYDFTITDTYGDGICCSYGNGSYTVSDSSTTYASGGNFTSSETTGFCIGGGGGPTPTCDDGVQNGNETGIDCGGDCDACPTCDDGIQNGNETDVDCGGDCDACPTCDDGIQNGNETGVDCGGDCAPCGGSGGSTEILGSYFESGWDGWIDGGSDCYRYSGSRSYEGNRSIRIRDNSGNGSSMSTGTYNLSSYSSIDIEFYFYAYSMENGEDFWVRYNDGSGWQTVASYARGTDFNNNTFYTATVTLNSGNYNLSNSGSFRFQCDASGNNDHIYIDQVTITGNSNTRAQSGNSLTLVSTMDEGDFKYEEDIHIFPNPATSQITLEVNEVSQIKILNLQGEVVMRLPDFDGFKKVDVSTLPSGVYLISGISDTERVTQKIVIE